MDPYLLLGLSGGGILLLSVLLGHDHHAGEADYQHDAQVGHGEAHPEHHPELQSAAQNTMTPLGTLASFFTLRSLLFFLTFFGLGGTLGRMSGLSQSGTLMVALVSGLITSMIASSIFQLVRKQGNLTERHSAVTGRQGTVIVPPRNDQPGKATIVIGGRSEQIMIRSSQPLSVNQEVTVTGRHPDHYEVVPS